MAVKVGIGARCPGVSGDDAETDNFVVEVLYCVAWESVHVPLKTIITWHPSSSISYVVTVVCDGECIDTRLKDRVTFLLTLSRLSSLIYWPLLFPGA